MNKSGLGRSRALVTGQTGFGVSSVGFMLGAAAKVVIHLQYRFSSQNTAKHTQKDNVIGICTDTKYIFSASELVPVKHNHEGMQRS